jgi:hypothetical protein
MSQQLAPYAHGREGFNGGHYRTSLLSGLITGGATIVAGAPLFAMRWNPPANAQQGYPVCILQHLYAWATITTAFGAAQQLAFQAFVARAFSANLTGGTALTPFTTTKANYGKLRTSMGPSLMADMRIASTTLLAAGTYTLDANPFAQTPSYLSTQAPGPQLVAEFNLARGESPLVLAPNEGIILANGPTAFGATGVCQLAVELSWAEAASF